MKEITNYYRTEKHDERWKKKRRKPEEIRGDKRTEGRRKKKESGVGLGKTVAR